MKNAHCDSSDVFFHPTSDPKSKESSFAPINATASLTFKRLEAACAYCDSCNDARPIEALWRNLNFLFKLQSCRSPGVSLLFRSLCVSPSSQKCGLFLRCMRLHLSFATCLLLCCASASSASGGRAEKWRGEGIFKQNPDVLERRIPLSYGTL